MLKYLILAGAALLILGLVFYALESGSLPNDELQDNVSMLAAQNNIESVNESRKRPECLFDLDCGSDNMMDYGCWEDFVVQDHISYECLSPGLPNATCMGFLRRMVFDWCRPDEICKPGSRVCEPNPALFKEQDVVSPIDDCVRTDSGECVIYCETDADCGIPRWSRPYCGPEDNVYQDYWNYTCRNAGTPDSFCSRRKYIKLADYCGPLNPCVEGECLETRYRGQIRPIPYQCKGQECLDLGGQVFLTCMGRDCFELKEYG
jgi:hypothetical protein